MLLDSRFLTLPSYSYRMRIRVVQKKLFFKIINPSPPKIVRFVIETTHTKFRLFGPQGEEGMQFEILNFRRKYGFFAHFSINFYSQTTWYLSFF